MAMATKPQEQLAQKVLPAPLRTAIVKIFKDMPAGIALVGGTALAGFYAGHRRSDDIDLFTATLSAQQAAIHLVKDLASIGATLSDELTTATYYHANITLDHHVFTADVVLDANLHRIGTFHKTKSGIYLADLNTLFTMKIATLVSRCSEKDLFDLLWLTEHFGDPEISEWISRGSQIDAGVNAETILISLTNAKLDLKSCGFATDFNQSSRDVLKLIDAFKDKLSGRLADYLEKSDMSLEIGRLIRKLKRT